MTQPHDVPLQALADGGVVGSLLLARSQPGRRGRRRAPAARRGGARGRGALAVPPAAWVVHGLVDNDSTSSPSARRRSSRSACSRAAGAAAVRARRPFSARRGRRGRARCGVLAARADARRTRRCGRSTQALERRDYAAAVDDADRARSLNPFSLDPLLARARAEWLGGDRATALAPFREAVDLQPREPAARGTTLGLFLFDTGDLCRAYRALNESYTLDPNGRQWAQGGPLDLARAPVGVPASALS